MTLNEFRNVLFYKNIAEWGPAFYKEWEIERLYMECQGNYSAYHQTYYKYMNAYMGQRRNF